MFRAQPPSSGYFVPTATASMGLMYPPVHTQAARPYHRLPTPPNTTQVTTMSCTGFNCFAVLNKTGNILSLIVKVACYTDKQGTEKTRWEDRALSALAGNILLTSKEVSER